MYTSQCREFSVKRRIQTLLTDPLPGAEKMMGAWAWLDSEVPTLSKKCDSFLKHCQKLPYFMLIHIESRKEKKLILNIIFLYHTSYGIKLNLNVISHVEHLTAFCKSV